jgi:hypothetical protein
VHVPAIFHSSNGPLMSTAHRYACLMSLQMAKVQPLSWSIKDSDAFSPHP